MFSPKEQLALLCAAVVEYAVLETDGVIPLKYDPVHGEIKSWSATELLAQLNDLTSEQLQRLEAELFPQQKVKLALELLYQQWDDEFLVEHFSPILSAWLLSLREQVKHHFSLTDFLTLAREWLSAEDLKNVSWVLFWYIVHQVDGWLPGPEQVETKLRTLLPAEYQSLIETRYSLSQLNGKEGDEVVWQEYQTMARETVTKELPVWLFAREVYLLKKLDS